MAMTDTDLALRGASRRIKLDTLIGLRWIAIGGQTAAILVVWLWLGFDLPVVLCFALTALSAWLNLFLKLRYPPNMRLRDTPAALLLAYDALQLAGLLYLTGGLQNPFALLLLVPVIVSATTLSLRHTIALGTLTVLLATLLWPFHEPLPWDPALGEMNQLPVLYIGGVWLAVLSALMFSAFYTFRVASEARKLATALSATELVLEREHHLSELDGLAAAAAHELGTPLATIAVVAKELQKELDTASPLASDVALLISQSERCRAILGQLTSLGTRSDWSHDRRSIRALLAEAIEPYAGGDIEVVVEIGETDGQEPTDRRNPATLYGLGNLIENAVDFAHSKVEVKASWNDQQVMVEISDDGPGFAAEVIDRLGEPYVTTRAPVGDFETQHHEAGGFGLGFFIAKTFLERSGARLRLANHAQPATGAVVRITWPREAYGRRGDDETAAPEAFGDAGKPAYISGEGSKTVAATES
jgi:two-component system sensor histidine kinase RegB